MGGAMGHGIWGDNLCPLPNGPAAALANFCRFKT